MVVTAHGEIRLKAVEVRSITPGKTRHDLYEERVRESDASDASANVALGDWCRDQGLTAEARRHWQRAIEIDPDHETARARLGFIRYEGRWLTEDEYRTARGLVKVKGEWIPAEEARRRDADKLTRDALRKHEKTIRDCLVKLGSPLRDTRRKGKLALQAYAESLDDVRLAAFASDVAEYYNAQWRVIREQMQADALTEIRATHAQLKRPIPTFTTSLGAFSTPVTIQLPELSVVSIRTTARVPMRIELDEDE